MRVGARRRTVRLKVWVKLAHRGCNRYRAGGRAGLTETCARPLESVFTVLEDSEAGPVTENCTPTLAAGCPLLAFTCTTRGRPKVAFTRALWLLPETIDMPVTVTKEPP